MQTKLTVGLVLSAIIIPTLTLLPAIPAKAQYGDRDPHYYCDGFARDRFPIFSGYQYCIVTLSFDRNRLMAFGYFIN